MNDRDFKQSQIDSFNADIEGMEQEKEKLLGYVNATEGAIMYAKGKRDKLLAELDASETKGDGAGEEPLVAVMPESFQPAQNGSFEAKAKKR